MLNGIFWVLRSGAPWRDLPERYGLPTTCYTLRPVAQGGRLGSADGSHHCGVLRRYSDDRQHFHQGAPTGYDGKKGDRDHCLGRSRGGLTTKIHAVVDAKGLPIRLSLTTGQAHDGPAALSLLDRLDPRTSVLADKAYDADGIRNLIGTQGAVPNIPAKSNRKWKPCFSKVLYRERNLVERFFSKLEHFRRIATDTTKSPKTPSLWFTSVRLWLRAYESTA